MSSGCRTAWVLAALGAACVSGRAAPGLRVCADPNNLPYSNQAGQGFENKLAAMVGRDLARPVQYLWIPQRAPFFKALQQGVCDLVVGVPSGFQMALTTQPYYRSSYMFASRRGRRLAIRSFDDARLKTLRIGLQIVAEGDGDVPPARALARRGLIRNISWYRLNQNFLGASHPADLLDAVERGKVDVAIVWGPVAGYEARRSGTPLELTPVSPQAEGGIPFAFDISMGVRPGDASLQAELNSIIRRRRGEIRALLERYGVPLVSRTADAVPVANR